jgi:hypothetical protein
MLIDPIKLAQILEVAKSRTNDARWHKAIDKAADKLLKGELLVTLLAHDALVTSENGSYRVNGHCNCPARVGHCYHRCAVRLVQMMEETATTPVAVDEKTEVITALKAAWDRKYAGNRRYDLGYTVMQICGATELERAPIYYLKQLLRALPLADV